ncbi:TetR/AcrR family transcriptional regulator [Mycobacterium palustre]|uniref:TetR family transcriptional regulator n=1 Tax=Mycobacterium palustre TaxID=153971 RepID=A0A1X1YY61_9MYCO|nr:TetR/AcrR family transcriptional regulator [Mycobacterium palustre]MCV7099716.1 TetR/AcrR family transcriptional regulator [Mycobacterium palustre]ORW16016.1 TetR family transcriptional regulator [Mycobacterium palustre]
MSSPLSRRRNKLAPDPDVRGAIVAAASRSVQDQGVRGLSIAAVLERAQLSTRAFYRHFESKDQLVAAVFLEMARRETQRLRSKMASARCPVEAVVAWVDGRLELAFGETAESDLRRLSLEAQSKAFSSPHVVAPAYSAILEPLTEQLQLGLELGVFDDIAPATAAKSIHGVVWAGTQRHWARHRSNHREVRDRALRFCLRGLGVAPDMIERVTARDAPVG